MNPYQTTDYATGPVEDQLIKYDTAILDWLKSDFDIIPGKSTHISVATPARTYAEPESGIHETQGVHTLPRIVVTRGDYDLDSARFNSNRVRRLGRVPATHNGLNSIYQGQYPVPINIPYQIDFWSVFARETNLWAQRLLFQYAFGYKYYQINVDTVWGNKLFCTFMDGSLSDQSNLEPGDGHRIIRRSVLLRAECWLYDQDLSSIGVVKKIDMAAYNLTDNTLIETFTPNRRQTVTSAIHVTFSTGFTPILEDTLVILAKFGGSEEAIQDDGNGVLFGDHVDSGSIDYVSGLIDLEFTSAPDADDLIVSWLTDVE